MAANTPMMPRASIAEGRVDLGTLASGQVAGVDDLPSCAELLARIMSEADEALGRLSAVAPPGVNGAAAAIWN